MQGKREECEFNVIHDLDLKSLLILQLVAQSLHFHPSLNTVAVVS